MMKKPSPIKGIKIKGANGSDYVLSVLDIAKDKAEKMSAGGKNPRVVMGSSILPDFAKNPEKMRAWAKKMDPKKMKFIKTKVAVEPSSEELARDFDKGVIE